MHGIKVAGKIALNNPASRHTLFAPVLQLQLYRTYRMVNTAGWSEAVGGTVKVALPDRLHRHEHCPLHNPIPKIGYTQRPELAVRLRNVDSSCRQRRVGARHQLNAYGRKLVVEIALHDLFIGPVYP